MKVCAEMTSQVREICPKVGQSAAKNAVWKYVVFTTSYIDGFSYVRFNTDYKNNKSKTPFPTSQSEYTRRNIHSFRGRDYGRKQYISKQN